MAGSSEWAGLAELATELGVDELADVADIADLASHAGAGVYSTLMARATSLRRELQSKGAGSNRRRVEKPCSATCAVDRHHDRIS